MSAISTTLANPIEATDTTISVTSWSGFPAAGTNYTVIVGGEEMLVTAGQGTATWIVTRGVVGTKAQAQAGTTVVLATDAYAIFYDNYVPSLKAGSYSITLSQSLDVDSDITKKDPGDDTHGIPPTLFVEQKFIVRGPRFAIDPADIASVFPPSNGSGLFGQFLPMIVFNKRALPWEREMAWTLPQVSTERYPWVALLVFADGELQMPDTSEAKANPTRSVAIPLDNVVKSTNTKKPTTGPPAGVIGPRIFVEDDEDPASIRVNVIDVDAALFSKIVPTGEDTRFLSHVRQVSTQHKEPTGAVHDGWYAVVVANRFSPKVETGGSPARRIVHLVSLEGLEDLIGLAAPTTPSGKVRMISLYSWTFTETSEPVESFTKLMTNVAAPESGEGTDWLLRIPQPIPSKSATVADRLKDGYTALDYEARTGESTFAWYRGPLAPVATTEFSETGQFNPLAPIYDQTNGLFDQSYAVAFQTGRSLALASKPFALALVQWRRQTHRLVDLIAEAIHSPQRRDALQQAGIVDASGTLTTEGKEDLAALLDADFWSNTFSNFLATDFADSLAAQIGATGGFTADDSSARPATPAPPTPSRPTPSSLKDLMGQPAIQHLLQRLTGWTSDPNGPPAFEAARVPVQIVQWLARVTLLHAVPFDNLVPTVQMLPEESIRFFYVDSNWTDALVDGALSVGSQTTRDSLFTALIRKPLRLAVAEVLHEVRDRLRGVTSQPPPAQASQLAGFLLRSPVVSGWPGLEVRAYADSAGTTLLKPLRLDRVGPSVLIGIFPAVPQRIDFREPSEGLVFGRRDDGSISMRYVPGVKGTGSVGEDFTVLTPPQTGDILRVSGADSLVDKMKAQLGGTVTLSPASFALQMVKVPEMMQFTAQPKTGSRA